MPLTKQKYHHGQYVAVVGRKTALRIEEFYLQRDEHGHDHPAYHTVNVMDEEVDVLESDIERVVFDPTES